MKNKVLIAILIVALFIPSFVAIGSYVSTTQTPVSAKNIISAQVSDPLGYTYETANKENGGAEEAAVTLFSNLLDNGVKGTLPDQLSDAPFYRVVLSERLKATEYRFYFTQSADQAYCVNTDDGTVLHLSAADAGTFLQTKYAACLYEEARVPTLKLNDDTALSPLSLAWAFKAAGKYVDCETAGYLAKETPSFDLAGGFRLAFSTEPDLFTVKVTDAATKDVLFDGEYKNIAALDLSSSASLEIRVSAKWYEDAARTYRGEAVYDFKANVTAPAAFFAGSTSTIPGGVVAISAKNVTNPEAVKMTSSPDIGVTPTFFKDGDYVHALVPFNYDLAGGTYTLTFTYGAVSQTVNIEVANKTFRTFASEYTSTLLSLRTAQTLAAAEKELSPLIQTPSAERLFDNGLFASGIPEVTTGDGEEGLFFGGGFGTYRDILLGGEKVDSMRYGGVHFVRMTKDDVTAVNNGKVAYVGYTTYTGNIIAIDHGYGLMSWYAFLSSADVAVGDTVEKGQSIGKIGSTGFTNAKGVYVELTVGSVPISPYPLWEEGIPMYSFEGTDAAE